MQKPNIPNFDFERCCGSGAYGDVWVANDINGLRRAVKVLYKTRLKNLGVLDKEIRGLRLYCKEVPRHPNLIEVFYAGETEELVYYVMELADNVEESEIEYIPDTLAWRLNLDKRLSPINANNLVWSILDAVSALHQVGLVHRDIKPDNIVYVNGKPKLADIGLIAANVQEITIAGTYGFIPPEGVDGCGADLYAAGKLLYCSLTGKDVSAFPSLPDDFDRTKQAAQLNKILLKACAHKKSKRFQDAFDFQVALQGEHPSFSRFRYLTVKNAIAIVALIISIIALSIAGWNSFGNSSNGYPPESIREKDDLFLPELKMRLIFIPSGKFLMEKEKSNSDVSNVHRVTIADHYWIGKYEVTQQQYESIIGTNPSQHIGKNLPVESITWPDAIEFCRRLTKQEQAKDRLPDGYEYRLPTESEWEYAAIEAKERAQYKYSGSNHPAYFAWYENNANGESHEVGRKNSNALGLYDFSGNVWEFCLFDPNIKKERLNVAFVKKNVIIRGGSWKTNMEDLKLFTKYYCSPDIKLNDIGFRVVLGPKIKQ